MSLTGIDTSLLINQSADSEIVKELLLDSSISWDRLAIAKHNSAFFASLDESYPGSNITRETVFAKRLNPKFPGSHEACDFYVIEINFFKFDDDEVNAKFEIAHGVKADFGYPRAKEILGKPSMDDESFDSGQWKYPDYDFYLSFDNGIDRAIISSNTPETIEIIALSRENYPNNNHPIEKTSTQSAQNSHAKHTTSNDKNYVPTISEPKKSNGLVILLVLIILILATWFSVK